MRAFILPAFAFALGIGFLSAPEAQARFNQSQVEAPSLIEDVACVTRRVRTRAPNGRIVYRNVRQCGVHARPRCRWVQERVRLPNGRVVVRSVQRCSPRW